MSSHPLFQHLLGTMRFCAEWAVEDKSGKRRRRIESGTRKACPKTPLSLAQPQNQLSVCGSDGGITARTSIPPGAGSIAHRSLRQWLQQQREQQLDLRPPGPPAGRKPPPQLGPPTPGHGNYYAALEGRRDEEEGGGW